MGQSTATAVPATTGIGAERISGQAFPLRVWGPRILIVALMAVGFLMDNMQPAQVNHYLTEVLTHFAESLVQGALVSVNERAIRVRLLPITDKG